MTGNTAIFVCSDKIFKLGSEGLRHFNQTLKTSVNKYWPYRRQNRLRDRDLSSELVVS